MLYPTNTFSRICTNTSFRNWSFCCQGLHNEQFDHTHLNSCKTCLPRKIFRCTFTRTYPCCPNLHPLLIAESTSDERLISNTAFAESSLSWLVFRLHLDFLAEDMTVFPPSGERLGVFPSQRIPQRRQFVCCSSSCCGEAYKQQPSYYELHPTHLLSCWPARPRAPQRPSSQYQCVCNDICQMEDTTSFLTL